MWGPRTFREAELERKEGRKSESDYLALLQVQ